MPGILHSSGEELPPFRGHLPQPLMRADDRRVRRVLWPVGPTSTDHSHNCTAITLEMAIFDSDIMVQHYKGKGRHHLIDADHGKVHTRNRVEVG
jgi:hypothetical protein